MNKIIFNAFLSFFTIVMPLNGVAADAGYKGTFIFTSPVQRRQLDALRKRIKLGELVEDIPVEIEQIKAKKIELLPKINFKGLVKKEGSKAIFWIENETNLQGNYQYENGISVVDVKNNQIEINYRGSIGIKLQASQVFIPQENKIYEGYELHHEKEDDLEEAVSDSEVETTSKNNAITLINQAKVIQKNQATKP